jgi:hypothetical protein
VIVVGAAVAIAKPFGSGGGPLSAPEFRQQANAICRTANADIKALGKPHSIPAFAAWYRKGVAITTFGYRKLAELTPPTEMRAEVQRAFGIDNHATAVQASFITRFDNETSAAHFRADVKALKAFGRSLGTADNLIWKRLGVIECVAKEYRPKSPSKTA